MSSTTTCATRTAIDSAASLTERHGAGCMQRALPDRSQEAMPAGPRYGTKAKEFIPAERAAADPSRVGAPWSEVAARGSSMSKSSAAAVQHHGDWSASMLSAGNGPQTKLDVLSGDFSALTSELTEASPGRPLHQSPSTVRRRLGGSWPSAPDDLHAEASSKMLALPQATPRQSAEVSASNSTAALLLLRSPNEAADGDADAAKA
mmetsp:Transcript_163502/g.524246  ORF Transcript_163502/g.524246 Transcript_163502/m.524246 type:complete len:205 (-) Transcript_163502:270-884(-)